MKLLLDENISRRLVAVLQAAFPGSSHVVLEGLASANDAQVWRHAGAEGFSLVSKDEDFVAMSGLLGPPPRLIKLSLGNCSNEQVLGTLLAQQGAIETAFADRGMAMIELIPSA